MSGQKPRCDAACKPVDNSVRIATLMPVAIRRCLARAWHELVMFMYNLLFTKKKFLCQLLTKNGLRGKCSRCGIVYKSTDARPFFARRR
jgi:hypothetical protein